MADKRAEPDKPECKAFKDYFDHESARQQTDLSHKVLRLTVPTKNLVLIDTVDFF